LSVSLLVHYGDTEDHLPLLIWLFMTTWIWQQLDSFTGILGFHSMQLQYLVYINRIRIRIITVSSGELRKFILTLWLWLTVCGRNSNSILNRTWT